MGSIVSQLLSPLLHSKDVDSVAKLQGENETLRQQLAERSSAVASLEERRKNLETLLAQANELTDRQRRAAGQTLARCVSDACKLIHGQIMALYKQQGSIPTWKLNMSLNNILAECRFVLQVRTLYS